MLVTPGHSGPTTWAIVCHSILPHRHSPHRAGLMSTDHTEPVSLTLRELALLEAAAEVQGLSLADYLRVAGLAVAREVMGLEVFSPEELAETACYNSQTAEG